MNVKIKSNDNKSPSGEQVKTTGPSTSATKKRKPKNYLARDLHRDSKKRKKNSGKGHYQVKPSKGSVRYKQLLPESWKNVPFLSWGGQYREGQETHYFDNTCPIDNILMALAYHKVPNHVKSIEFFKDKFFRSTMQDLLSCDNNIKDEFHSNTSVEKSPQISLG